MTLKYAELGVQLAGHLAWPTAAMVIRWLFRTQLTELFKRIRSAELFGVKNEFGPAELTQGQQSQTIKTLPEQSFSTFKSPPSDDDVLTPMDSFHRNALETEVQDPALRESWAIRMWSNAELQRRHEATYRLIFGSQIAALKALQLWGDGRAERFEPFYKAAAANPEFKEFYDTYTWESWANFMLRTGYVEEISDSEDHVRITPLGKNFLHWLIANRVTEAKGL